MAQVADEPTRAGDALDQQRSDDAGPGLTPRQSQILALLQKGKSNKEIATELGIGLGTVKQHINVLFKRLDVSNRTMAVTRGQSLTSQTAAAAHASATTVTSTRMPELRPAAIVSFTLPPAALEALAESPDSQDGPEEDSGHGLHRVLAAVASDFGAVFIAHDHGGDLVFGVQRCREQDVLRALRAAFSVARDARLAPVLDQLRGGLDAGLIAVGMTARGVWDGEMVAGALLGRCRDLADAAEARQLSLGSAVQGLIETLCGSTTPPAALDLTEPASLRYDVRPARYGLRGRVREMAVLETDAQAAANGSGQAILIEGEAGIGKSTLLAALPLICDRFDLPLEIWRCLPPDGQPVGPARGHLVQTATGETQPIRAVIDRLTAPGRKAAPVIGIDDVHWLPFDAAARLFEAAGAAAALGRMTVITARPAVAAAVGAIPGGRQMRLGRLDRPATEALLDKATGGHLRPEAKAAICDRAGGVPLFALHLARSITQDGATALHPPLPLVSLLISRMDGLQLDRRLLRLLAERAGPRPIETLRDAWQGSEAELDAAIRTAVKAGLVRQTEAPAPSLTIGHPMLQAVLAHVMTDWQSMGGRP